MARLEALVSQERENIADIVNHLAEVDRREIVIDRGYTTLFDYCLKKLHYSEAGAFLRIRAARAANEFPRILTDLKSGAIHLDAIARLYPHLKNENSDRLLDQAVGASKREVMALVARLGGADTAPERDIVRYMSPKPAASLPPNQDKPIPPLATPRPTDISLPQDAVIVAPPSRIRLAFTADDQFLLMVNRLRSLRRHKFPGGRLEDILKEAVMTLLDKIDPDRRAGRGKIGACETAKVRKRSRRIPASVKTEVWRRDGGRCAFLAQDGRRCESRDFLEYDHVTPWALGGRSDLAGNIRLLCRPHNQRLARRRFGPRRG